MINTANEIRVFFVRECRNWKRANRYSEHKNQHNRPNKLRNHRSRESTNCQYPVNFLASVHCRSDATQNAYGRNQNQCNNCQLRRLTGCGPQNFANGLFILQRSSEVASQYPAHPSAILHNEWFIEAFFFIPDFKSFNSCVSAKSLLGDIARQNRGHQKNDYRDDDKSQKRQPNSLDNESQHRNFKFSNDRTTPLDLQDK